MLDAAASVPDVFRTGRLPADPGAGPAGPGCDTAFMPVLDPNPQNGQRKLLLVFGTFFAILIVIGIVASIASP
ncbi:hypothetical protein OK074_4601 [Actinobacteria bacterium OK074]|nr:hypothetical protein OK074_4601 [Actinobacteria bacterium OK074]